VGGRGSGGERDPGIDHVVLDSGAVGAACKQLRCDVVPKEQPVPALFLGVHGQLDDVVRIAESAEMRNVKTAFHDGTLAPPVGLCNDRSRVWWRRVPCVGKTAIAQASPFFLEDVVRVLLVVPTTVLRNDAATQVDEAADVSLCAVSPDGESRLSRQRGRRDRLCVSWFGGLVGRSSV
jgi:hypothetical protein